MFIKYDCIYINLNKSDVIILVKIIMYIVPILPGSIHIVMVKLLSGSG